MRRLVLEEQALQQLRGDAGYDLHGFDFVGNALAKAHRALRDEPRDDFKHEALSELVERLDHLRDIVQPLDT